MKIVVRGPWSVVCGILEGDNPLQRTMDNEQLTSICTKLKDRSWLNIFLSFVVPAVQA